MTNNPFDIEEYNREIEEGLAEIERGNYMTQEELEQVSAKWHEKYSSQSSPLNDLI